MPGNQEVPLDATDGMILQAMANGNAHALDELYTRHGPALLSYLVGQLDNRQQAEEVLQDVMLAAWNGAARFRGDSKVRTWLIAIARNHAINVRRKRKPTLVELHENVDADTTGPLERLERKAQANALRAAIRQLPEQQRETLELVFFHQLTGPEAADVLGVSVGTIKSRLNPAKQTLRRMRGREGNLDR